MSYLPDGQGPGEAQPRDSCWRQSPPPTTGPSHDKLSYIKNSSIYGYEAKVIYNEKWIGGGGVVRRTKTSNCEQVIYLDILPRLWIRIRIGTIFRSFSIPHTDPMWIQIWIHNTEFLPRCALSHEETDWPLASQLEEMGRSARPSPTPEYRNKINLRKISQIILLTFHFKSRAVDPDPHGSAFISLLDQDQDSTRENLRNSNLILIFFSYFEFWTSFMVFTF